MKKFVPFILISMLALAACSPSAEKLVNNGNEAYANQAYADALAAYQAAQTESSELAEPHYNSANAHYREGDYEGAMQEIEQTLLKDDGDLVQNSFYNLGNNFYQAQELEQAVEAYKEALRLNPADVEAKHNLELALQQQQQEQEEQQQEQNEEQENQDQQNQDEQQSEDQQEQDDQNQDQQEQEQNQNQQNQDQQQNEEQQENQDQQEQDDQNQDQQEQEQNQDQQQDGQGQPQEQDEQQQEGQPNGQPQQVQGLTEEQAKQLLEAAAQGSESLEEHLQQIMVVPGAPPAKDW